MSVLRAVAERGDGPAGWETGHDGSMPAAVTVTAADEREAFPPFSTAVPCTSLNEPRTFVTMGWRATGPRREVAGSSAYVPVSDDRDEVGAVVVLGSSRRSSGEVVDLSPTEGTSKSDTSTIDVG